MMESNKTVWITGRLASPSWDIQGVFILKDDAIKACRDQTYFIGPMVLGKSLPHDTQHEWPGLYYPLEGQSGLCADQVGKLEKR